MANIEQFQNAIGPVAALTGPISSTATTITVTSATNFPALESGQQCRLAVQDVIGAPVELMLAVGPSSGTSYTVQRGIEGTTAAAHVIGATVAPVITAQIFSNIYPSAMVWTENGNFSWPSPSVKKIALAQETAGACTISIDPTVLIPGQSYSLKDAAYICESHAIILAPVSGLIDNAAEYQLSADGQAVGFWSDGTNLWVN